MKVYAYARLSRDDEKNNYNISIENQIKIIKEYAKEHNMIISKMFTDINQSGYTLNRENFNIIRDELNLNQEKITIIVKDLSRLSRHNGQMSLFLENIKQEGHRVIAISDRYDSDDEDSDEFLGLIGFINERAVVATSKKVKQVIKMKQKEGSYISCLPYGYSKVPNSKSDYVVDDVAAQYVQMIFSWYINENLGFNAIAKRLNAMNAPTASALTKQRIEARGDVYYGQVSEWKTAIVRKIIKNDFYTGTLRLRKSKRVVINGKKVPTDQSEQYVFKDAHPAIIDNATFNLAQRISEKRIENNFRGKKNNKAKRLFSGLLKCADCGSNMSGSGLVGHESYRCPTYIEFGRSRCAPHNILDKQLKDIVIDFMLSVRDKLKQEIEDLDNTIKEEYKRRGVEKNSLNRLEKRLEECKKEFQYITEKRIKESMASPDMAEIIDATYINIQKAKVDEIKSLEAQIQVLLNKDIDENALRKDMMSALEMYDETLRSRNITKKQLEILIDKIIVHDTCEVDIYLNGDIHKLVNNHVSYFASRELRVAGWIYDYIADKKYFTAKAMYEDEYREDGVSTRAIASNLKMLAEHGYIKQRPGRGYDNLLLEPNNDKLRNEVLSVLIGRPVDTCSMWCVNNKTRFDVAVAVHEWIQYINNPPKIIF